MPGTIENPKKRIGNNPDDIDARTELYLALIGADQASAEGVQIAAGCGDPAAANAVKRAGMSPLVNRLGSALASMRGLPVDRLDLYWAEESWLHDLVGLPLRSLSLEMPSFWFTRAVCELLQEFPLEELSFLGSFGYPESESIAPISQRLRRLSLSTHADFDDAFLKQLEMSRLEELSLDSCDEMTDDSMKSLRRLPLRRLTLQRLGEVTSRGLSALHDLPLEHLELTWNREIYSDPGCLGGFAALRSLTMDQCYFGNACLKAASRSALRRLRIPGSFVTRDGLDHLADMPLEELDLYGAREFDGLADTLASLRSLPLKKLGLADFGGYSNRDLAQLRGMALEDLNLALNDVDEAGLRHLEGLPLKRLDLSYSRLTRKALEVLVDLGLPLEELNLSGVRLKNADLRLLKKLPLRSLTLSDKWLTDAGVAQLEGLPLRSLSLSGLVGETHFTDASLPVLTSLPLEELWLFNCNGFSTDGWTRLAALPARVYGPGI